MRILITGAGGLLGGRLAAVLSKAHETIALVRNQSAPAGIAIEAADLVDETSVSGILRRLCPQAVIHCAALADPEICERDPKLARRENEIATRTLAAACAREEARLISISTDLVFGGETPFSTEASSAAPISEYGRSKLRAEAAALEQAPDCVILRVALVIGRGHGPRWTASENLAHRLRRGEPVTLFADEWRTPIDPESVAAAVEAVLEKPAARGIFHIGGAERWSRAEMGDQVARVLGLPTASISRPPRSSHQGAPRPRDVSLDSTRAGRELGWAPRPLLAAIGEGRNG